MKPALNMLNTNVVSANAARPSGPGSATAGHWIDGAVAASRAASGACVPGWRTAVDAISLPPSRTIPVGAPAPSVCRRPRLIQFPVRGPFSHRMSFAEHLDHEPFRPATVEFAIEDGLPGAEVE